ncbi:MAG: Ppx/GppA phosphatase family protein, partial [Candidatus Halalkalibacterium sp. M3_1C_030]
MASAIHAAIDIGTNTVLLLIAEKEGPNIHTLLEEQRIPRLGKGVDSSGNLDKESIQRVVDVLKEYRQIINSSYPNIQSLTVTATSAVRDAENRKDFTEKVQEATGFKVKVLSGEQEADFTFKGALSVLP